MFPGGCPRLVCMTSGCGLPTPEVPLDQPAPPARPNCHNVV